MYIQIILYITYQNIFLRFKIKRDARDFFFFQMKLLCVLNGSVLMRIFRSFCIFFFNKRSKILFFLVPNWIWFNKIVLESFYSFFFCNCFKLLWMPIPEKFDKDYGNTSVVEPDSRRWCFSSAQQQEAARSRWQVTSTCSSSLDKHLTCGGRKYWWFDDSVFLHVPLKSANFPKVQCPGIFDFGMPSVDIGEKMKRQVCDQKFLIILVRVLHVLVKY